ncbi:MAG: aminotransferase class I/II-fold pyridoxal phosphate-dependent enzyme [Bacteroidetes bacterium]|nr:aminotransferase class I/II-fold pyridoxal phosphate-dependent enzyme [Bacteroidota bacterium]
MKPHFETRAIRQQTERSSNREHSVPVYMTSSFVFEDAEQARALFAEEVQGNIYTRFSNPNNTELISKICELEQAEDGLAVASGMSAIFTTLGALLKQGDHILASKALFGSSHQILNQLLPKWGITTTYVSLTEPDSWSAALTPSSRLFLVETPSNPGLELVDLEKLATFCKSNALISVVDNCFATPYLQQPITLGIDLVTHSATKFIDGQGRAIGGLIAGRADLMKDIRFFARHTGPSLSPFNAWLFSKSLETLAIRMDRHCQSAMTIARQLELDRSVERVIYPFLDSHPQSDLARRQMKLGGGIVSFILRGGLPAGQQFLNHLKMISHTANLGDTRTTATHPASTTHSKLSEADRLAVGITPGLIRISVGLEHPDDIAADLFQALGSIDPSL